MRWGKIIGFIIGHWLLSWPGALLGLLVGHLFDVYQQQKSFFTFGHARQTIQQMRQAFFDTTFMVMGHIAKSDGRVSEQEIEASRYIMQRMDLNESQKQRAMALFTAGKQPEFNIEATLAQLVNACHHNFIMLQMFVDIQLQAVKLSGPISIEKQQILQKIFRLLGHAPSDFGRGQTHSPHAYHGEKLKAAYRMLEIPETASPTEIKRAYRRLMSQHHPDKLIAKGLPEAMLKLATEKAQNIQLAYELIRKTKGF